MDGEQSAVQVLFTAEATQVTVGQTVAAFLQAEMAGKSPQTEHWYRLRLTGLAAALGAGRLLADIQEVDLLEWRSNLAGAAVSTSGDPCPRYSASGDPHPRYSTYTFHGYVRVARRLFKWLFKRGILPVNLAADLELPKLPRQLRNGISDDNMLAILESARENPRDYAILMFLATTGARRAGVANLRLENLDLNAEDPRLRRRVTVLEKGVKERVVLLTPEALEALADWLAVRPDILDDHVFLGQRPGEDWHPMTPSGISQIVERYKERLGLTGRTSPHQWRHRFCRRKLQQGMDLSQVSQLAGHEDPAITIRFYGGYDIDQLQASFDQHPEL